MEVSRYLFTVNKATSEIDFFLPLIWKLKQERPDIIIFILFLGFDKKKILRESSFYLNQFKKIGVNIFDFYDFSSIAKQLIFRVFNKLSPGSRWDIQHLSKYSNGKNKLNLKAFLNALNKKIEDYLAQTLDFDKLFSYFNPNIVFHALRSYQYPGREEFVKNIYVNNVRVILYPHGPFISNGVDYIPPFSEREKDSQAPLPNFCEYWHSLKQEKTKEHFPAIQDRIFCVGYPGLDSEWLQYLRNELVAKKNPVEQTDSAKKIRCLFITRKFQKNATDYGVMQFEEFMDIVNSLVSLINQNSNNIELIVKPHPSNDFKGITKLMNDSGVKDWKISYEPVSVEAARSDLVVAVPSTSIIGPVLLGIPVIVLNCSIIDQFNDAWSFMKYFFSGFQYFANDLNEFRHIFSTLINELSNNKKSSNSKEIEFYRNLFPDRSFIQCIGRINHNIGKTMK
jgi:hypothetical protein